MSLLSGIGGLFGGLFGDSDKPYRDAMEQYNLYNQQAMESQKPYAAAGKEAIGKYNNWLDTQQDPSKFINNLQSNYQQSPYNDYLQQQSQFVGQNAASASGLMGSSPFMQQQQQNSANIAQQGMDDWLKNVLGINTQYGQGQNNLMQGGQNSANQLSNLNNKMGQRMGEAAYGESAGKNQDFWNTIGGGLGIIGSFL